MRCGAVRCGAVRCERKEMEGVTFRNFQSKASQLFCIRTVLYRMYVLLQKRIEIEIKRLFVESSYTFHKVVSIPFLSFQSRHKQQHQQNEMCVCVCVCVTRTNDRPTDRPNERWSSVSPPFEKVSIQLYHAQTNERTNERTETTTTR